ncbi:MAG: glycosyltransferase [Thaumarchaeota archaeon]|nr:glycosyltransferase [Nitrososphaerota archaeon]
MTRYSVCMTCFNEVATVRDSLSSLLGQLNENFEVVIVDNFSNDGTYEVLREFEQSHGVKVIRRRCSRGLGRQFAFENASGEYIIANLDLDDTFLPVLNEVVTRYHEIVGGKLLAVFNSSPPPDMTRGWTQNITIGPQKLIASLGGWRDLNVFEDWDIWSRANKQQSFGWTSFRFAANETLHPVSRRALTRLVQRYERYRNRLRLGLKIFSPGENIGLSQRLAYTGARLSLLSQGALVGQDPEFNSLDIGLFIDFGAGESRE